MAEAKERKRKAEEAHKQEMKQIQARKPSFSMEFQSIFACFDVISERCVGKMACLELALAQEDVDFRRMAAQAVEEATVAFGKKYETAEKALKVRFQVSFARKSA